VGWSHRFFIVSLFLIASLHPLLFAKGPGFIDFISDVPSWMMEQIGEDLAPFKKSGIRKADLDDLIESQKKSGNSYFLTRFIIHNQQVSVYPLPTDYPGVLAIISILTEAFNKLAKTAPLIDTDFIVTALDSLDGVHLSVPVFAFANDPTYSSNIVLMPDFGALTGNEGFLNEVKKGIARYPWELKLNQVIWRGATTGYPFMESLNRLTVAPPRMGGVFSVENFLDFPRTKAISLSVQFPSLINARYTTLCQCVDCDGIQSQYSQYFAPLLSIAQHLQYKYLLLIDGNSAAYSRAYWQLFSNSAIIKQDSDAVQWYSKALRPYVHYIPVRSDLSDLVDVIDWAMQHDDQAKEISVEAQNFAHKNLTYFHVMQYMYLLLTEYARLQQ
jgi:hypothetical protein